MIERSDGRFLAAGADHQLQLLAGDTPAPAIPTRLSPRTAENPEPSIEVPGLRRKTQAG